MNFINKDFLLKSDTAKKLYNDYAKKQPIFDFHCHLNPKEIYENNNFKDITEAWLGGDHYKWRAMRSAGVDEKYITGDADSFEKFKMWAKTIQYAIGNPLYHWAHLELQRFFGIYEPLTENNAKEIFDKVNSLLSQDNFKVRELIKKSNVKTVFTTDDPADTLEYHKLIKEDSSITFNVRPAFRPDKALNIDAKTFAEYIEKLASSASSEIKSFDDLKAVLVKRMNLFDEMGCKASDHAFVYVPFIEADKNEIENIFTNALNGEVISKIDADKYKTSLMKFLGCEYHKRNWAMEIHMNIKRDNNTKMFEKLGPDSGFDCIGDYSSCEGLTGLLNSLEYKNSLPKTILFAGNPSDNQVIGTILGCFQSSETASKIQFGTAWWFNDNKDGMEIQIKTLGNLGILGKFIGMLTDSRSFLSYPRHEYFRRILCNIIGQWIEDGEYDNNIEFAGKIISDICYNNAMEYFDVK